MASTRFKILMILLPMCVATACEHRGPVTTSTPASPATKPAADAPRLNAQMNDAEIIRAFGLDPKSAKPELVQGKDGTSTTYIASNQKVTVTRSLVSGVSVLASGPISGVWSLGKP